MIDMFKSGPAGVRQIIQSLTAVHKGNDVETRQRLLDLKDDHDKALLYRIVKRWETWCHPFEPEFKRAHSE